MKTAALALLCIVLALVWAGFLLINRNISPVILYEAFIIGVIFMGAGVTIAQSRD
jgi:hypothetical protein